MISDNKPYESLVRIENGFGAFGSGILLSNQHVLTCAHVVDLEFRQGFLVNAFDEETQDLTNHRPVLCESLAQRIGSTIGEVFFFNGKKSAARLIAVHGNEDLVLLELLTRVSFSFKSLGLISLDKNSKPVGDCIAYGFRKGQRGGFDVTDADLAPLNPNSKLKGTSGRTYSGTVTEGMSGGPIILEREQQYFLVGLSTLGGEAFNSVRIVDVPVIRAFLNDHKDKIPLDETNDTGLELGGLPDSLNWKMSTNLDLNWIRVTSSQNKTYHGRRAYYVASRPLLMSEDLSIDQDNIPPSLGKSLASTLIETDQAGIVSRFDLASKNLPFGSLVCPDIDQIRSLSKPIAKNKQLRIHKTNIPLTVLDLSDATEHQFQTAPTAEHEWVTVFDKGQETYCRAQWRGEEYILERSSLLPETENNNALLRPMISVDLWAD